MKHKDQWDKPEGGSGFSALELAEQLASGSSKYSAGFTICPWTKLPPAFGVDDYVVSLQGGERRFFDYPSQKEIYQWLRDNLDALSVPTRYIGGWRDDRDRAFYLDVSFAVSGGSEAESAGLFNGQVSIYHPASGKTIYLIGHEEEEAA